MIVVVILIQNTAVAASALNQEQVGILLRPQRDDHLGGLSEREGEVASVAAGPVLRRTVAAPAAAHCTVTGERLLA